MTVPTSSYEKRRAKRDAERAANEAYYAKQARESRSAHVKIVRDALWAEFARYPQGNPNHWAEVAVDALLADGVVFARMGDCNSNPPETGSDPAQYDGCQEGS